MSLIQTRKPPESPPFMSAADRSPVIDASIALDVAVHGIAIATRNGAQVGLAYVNAAFCALTGYDREDLLQGGLQLLAGSNSDTPVYPHLREAVIAGEDFTAEWLIHSQSGQVLWTRVTTRAADSKQVVITLEDITDYKRARESLRASESRLELAMEASELSMWDWNVEQDQVSYNDQWRISLGIDPSELVKREELSERLMLPADDSGVLEKFERHFHGGSPYFQSEYRLTAHDGTHKWFMAHAKVVRRDAAGKAQRVIGVLQDISRSKQDQRTALEVEQRWERAIRGTLDGLYEWDLLTGHVWYASRFRDIIGCADVNFAEHVPGVPERAARGRSRRGARQDPRASGKSEPARHSLSRRHSQRKHCLVSLARRGGARCFRVGRRAWRARSATSARRSTPRRR